MKHTPEQIEFWHATSHAFAGGARTLENRRAAFRAEFPDVPIPGDTDSLEDWESEKTLREAAVKALKAAGYTCLYLDAGSALETNLSKVGRPPAGYPDLTIMRDGRVCLIELKTGTGKASAAQLEQHARLERHSIPVSVQTTVAGCLEFAKQWLDHKPA